MGNSMVAISMSGMGFQLKMKVKILSRTKHKELDKHLSGKNGRRNYKFVLCSNWTAVS